MTLYLYDQDNEELVKQERTFTASSGVYWNDVAEFDVTISGSYAPFELFAKLTIEVNDELYYIRFNPQQLTTTDPGGYALGSN